MLIRREIRTGIVKPSRVSTQPFIGLTVIGPSIVIRQLMGLL